ncbi:ABC transporter substrate-binding protein [Bifidobacterium scardovii]|uniref:ABC transporter substrate-binding protein n=1 Tax=Bifidobacterium scardovii TaxID=158787 RepID=UPI00242ED282|nr:ABC transporter substrate-binding protein [Bifidobacterium scardovii]MBS6946930.1 ABC transporter substrate-binding protein [Bifidobacterium scardovii]
MMKNKAFAAIAVAALSLMPLAACGSGSGAGGYEIAMVAKGFSQSFWVSVHKGADDAASKYGATVTFNGPDNDSQVDKQAEMVQNAINKSPDAVAVAPLDEAALTPALQSAKSANIPLFAFDTAFDKNADLITASVKTSNTEVGKVAAENFIKLLGGKGKYAVIAHSQTDATSTERHDGFLDYMKENAPDMEMVGDVQYSNADQAKAQDIASAILQANPDLDGIFTTNEATVVGAATPVESAKKSGHDVVLVGVDSGKAQQQYIRDGVIAGSVSQNPYQIGYKTIEVAVKSLKGEKVDKSIDSGCFWYDASNIDDADVQQAMYD